jgi:hypothetical protein
MKAMLTKGQSGCLGWRSSLESKQILYWVRLAEVKIEDSIVGLVKEEKKLSMKLLRKWMLGQLPRSALH